MWVLYLPLDRDPPGVLTSQGTFRSRWSPLPPPPRAALMPWPRSDPRSSPPGTICFPGHPSPGAGLSKGQGNLARGSDLDASGLVWVSTGNIDDQS